MSTKTGIEWTDATWNPVTGCTKVSAGCAHCYAETWAGRHLGEFRKDRARKFTDVRTHADKLTLPLTWAKPRRIFVNSMSDLFHRDVPDAFIKEVFVTMANAPRHTFQILTKRPQRMALFLDSLAWWKIDPLPHVWIGTSVEDQRAAEERIPHLLMTPARVRFLSCEPLLGAVELSRIADSMPAVADRSAWASRLDWIIVGGESGPKARPMHPDWARRLRDYCALRGVPFFFKQWGEYAPVGDWLADDLSCLAKHPDGQRRYAVLPWASSSALRYYHTPQDLRGCEGATQLERLGKKAAGRLLDGREHNAMP